ncbi:MAG: T9SS type A sorting domain-containing protein [bacterium]|nr:T9SS type A sorting domain-containing protein [bacterium]
MHYFLLIALLGASLSSYAQSSDNEILQVAQLRADCVERSLCSVEVYPNPSTGPVHVDAPKGASCMVYSSSGTYVGTWEVGENGLDLVDLPSGIFIAAVTYNGIKHTSRIVILD